MTPDTVAYSCADIFDGHQRHKDAALLVRDGRVVEVCKTSSLPPGVERKYLGGGLIAPGLVDLQVNGGGGVMLNNEPTPETVGKVCDAHARQGTTSLLPTVITDTPERTRAAVSAVQQCVEKGQPGILGIHLEGPHLSVARKGAHDPALIRPMTDDDAAFLERLAKSILTLFLTVAPESVTNAQITRLTAAGAVLSLGHTNCDFDTATEAARGGAKSATHLFNAMSQLGSREPGLVGAVLASGEFSAGLIADGFHADPATIGIALRSKTGPGKIFLVSDAMATIGSDIRSFELNGRRIYRKSGRLTLSDGTLAGADIDLMSAVRYMVNVIGIDPDEAIRMASLYPAQLVGRSTEVGALSPGSFADFIHLNASLDAESVWRRGFPLS